MENYIWSVIGVVMFAAFIRVYWEVFKAWRAYRQLQAGATAARAAAGPSLTRRSLGWLAARADRALHVLLMSPTAR